MISPNFGGHPCQVFLHFLDAGPFHCYNCLIVLICPCRRDYCYGL